MIIELRPLDDSNIEACRKLKVSEKQADYIASNDKSIADAADNAKVARPFDQTLYIALYLVEFGYVIGRFLWVPIILILVNIVYLAWMDNPSGSRISHCPIKSIASIIPWTAWSSSGLRLSK